MDLRRRLTVENALRRFCDVVPVNTSKTHIACLVVLAATVSIAADKGS